MTLATSVQRALQRGAPWTLPRARAALSRFAKTKVARVLAWWVVWIALLNFTWVNLRQGADDVGFPVHGAELERALFGGLPTLWLQDVIHPVAPSVVEWSSVVVHTSWFIVPVLVAILVSIRSPDRIGSFFTWWLVTDYVCLIIFVLFPVKPPWMDDPEVKRFLTMATGDISDGNEIAALPSLHVARPFVLGLWLLRERWTWLASAMFAYAALIAFEVVLSGEHYIVDALAAVAVGLLVWGSVRIAPQVLEQARLAWRRLRKWRNAQSEGAHSALRIQRRESGQALVEFALILPFMFVLGLAILDGGMAVNNRIVLQHSVREGGRLASLAGTPAAVQQRTADQSEGLLDPADVTVCYINSNGNGSVGDAGDSVRVQAHYDHEFVAFSGELWDSMGSGSPTISMDPQSEWGLEAPVAGATACS